MTQCERFPKGREIGVQFLQCLLTCFMDSLSHPLHHLAILCGLVLKLLICFSVLSSNERCSYFCSALSSLPNFTKAFPPLLRESISVLQQLGRVVHAHITTSYPHITSTYVSADEDWSFNNDSMFLKSLNELKTGLDSHMRLYHDVRKTFFFIAKQTLS